MRLSEALDRLEPPFIMPYLLIVATDMRVENVREMEKKGFIILGFLDKIWDFWDFGIFWENENRALSYVLWGNMSKNEAFNHIWAV